MVPTIRLDPGGPCAPADLADKRVRKPPDDGRRNALANAAVVGDGPPMGDPTPLPPAAPVPAAVVSRGLVGRGMPRRLGPLLSLFARAFVDQIPLSNEDASTVQALARRGVVVYVHRARNPVEHLALTRLVGRLGLPRAAFVGGLNVLGLQSLAAAASRLWRGAASARNEEDLLERCVRAGHAAELFLRRPLHLLSTTSTVRARFVETLVRVQRDLNRPIFLVPCFLALRQRPGHFEPTAIDAVLGSVEEPGLVRALGRLIAARGAARFEMSDPVDLQAFVDERRDSTDAVLAKKVRWSILHHLAGVERIAHGPAMKSSARMRDDVLKDHELQKRLSAAASEQDVELRVLQKRAGKLHDEIAARFDVDIARILDVLLSFIWRQIYDKIDIDPHDLERVRAAARRGPLVLVPSHRSHVDYLIMSQVMLAHGMLPPHVAAGENLSFFPFGPIARRGGAFFLRRSFKGDALYGAVFRAYIRRLFKEGFTQEFFIEGTRSRTGKTLPPKLGLLSMLVDAFLESREQDAIFVPCHITYERIVEANAYKKELGGAAKEKESAKGLVKAAGVLGGRYGRVFVTFDEPISLASHLEARGVRRDASIDDVKTRAAVNSLGHAIVYGINRCAVVTAVSLVVTSLFGFRRRGVDEDLLLRGAEALVAHLARRGEGAARFEPGFDVGDADGVRDALVKALGRLVEDGLLRRAEVDARVLYQVPDSVWLLLDWHKNHLLHHFVPEAILATALKAAGAQPGVPIERAAVAGKARELSRAFKLEFIFRPGSSYDALFADAVRGAQGIGFIHADGGSLVVVDTPEAHFAGHFARNLIANFVEAYAVIGDALPVALASPMEERALFEALLERMKAAALAGEVVCAEVASKALVENAVASWAERGLVKKEGKLLHLQHQRRAALAAQQDLLTSARPRRR